MDVEAAVLRRWRREGVNGGWEMFEVMIEAMIEQLCMRWAMRGVACEKCR